MLLTHRQPIDWRPPAQNADEHAPRDVSPPPRLPGGEIYVSTKITNPNLSGIRRFALSVGFRLAYRRKVMKAMTRVGLGNTGLTIGVVETGYYRGKPEPAFAVRLFGQDSDTLSKAARSLADEFSQDCALVVDFNMAKSYLVFGAIAQQDEMQAPHP